MRLPVELLAAGVLFASCTALPPPRADVGLRPEVWSSVHNSTVTVGPNYSVGRARHTLNDTREFDETGAASWYGEELRGSPTALGERFEPNGISAAHRTLPLRSYVEVTSLDTGRTILVRINDRGPFHSNRIIDLSLGAARQLGMTGHGARQVRVRRVEPTDAEKHVLGRGEAVALRRSPYYATLERLRDRDDWKSSSRQSSSQGTAAREISGPGPFYLQIASFLSKYRARSLAEHLDAEISSIAGTWRVRLGPYESARKAMAALAPLAARGYPDVVITR